MLIRVFCASAPKNRQLDIITISLLCKGGFCCTLEELVCCGCALGELTCYNYALIGFSWSPPGICDVCTLPPRLLPAEVFSSGGEVAYVLLSNNNTGVLLIFHSIFMGFLLYVFPDTVKYFHSFL